MCPGTDIVVDDETSEGNKHEQRLALDKKLS